MTAEEAHVILAARNVYNAMSRHASSTIFRALQKALSPQQGNALVELANACARLEISERRELARGKASNVVRKLRLVK